MMAGRTGTKRPTGVGVDGGSERLRKVDSDTDVNRERGVKRNNISQESRYGREGKNKKIEVLPLSGGRAKDETRGF
jgi:hypothetical protein